MAVVCRPAVEMDGIVVDVSCLVLLMIALACLFGLAIVGTTLKLTQSSLVLGCRRRIDALMRVAVDTTMLSIRPKSGIRIVIACDVLPGVALLAEDGVKGIVVKATYAFNGVRLIFAIGDDDIVDGILVLVRRRNGLLTRLDLSVYRLMKILSHNLLEKQRI